jgi:hypothetical protein
LVNHTAGGPGEYFPDTGPGDDAAMRYTAGIAGVSSRWSLALLTRR